MEVLGAYCRVVNKFPATRESALQRLDDFLAIAPRYAATRNHVLPGHPQVSRLSAAIRHRLITECEVVEAALRCYPFRLVEKFLQEVMWRAFWKGWLEWRPGVWGDYKASIQRLGGGSPVCREVTEGRSPSGIMNHFARELVETGYMHNHARMWWASYWVHHCGLPWELGARFFMEHLLDADAASNTLSWRWVAGLQTKGKTYLATEQNIRRFCAPEILERAGGARFDAGVVARPVADDEASGVLELDHTTFPSEYPSDGGSRRLAVLMHDEDLSLETSPLAALKPGLLLHFVHHETGSSSPRGRWLEEARSDGALRARVHYGCEVRVCHDVDELASAASGADVEEVVMMQPFVGSLREVLDGLTMKLKERGVALTGVRRPWDNALQPYAQRGFFPFWNNVGRKLAKNGAEGIA